jgi:hypothetical protein
LKEEIRIIEPGFTPKSVGGDTTPGINVGVNKHDILLL